MSLVSRATRIVGVGLVSALALGGGGSSQVALGARAASDDRHPGQFSVAYEVSAPPTIVLPPSCDPAARCALPYANSTSQISGDVVGTAVGAGSAVIGPGLATSTAHAVTTATVAECGTGTFVVRYSIVYDLADVTGGPPGTWEVVPGFGTGDLASLTGGGTFALTQSNPDLSNVSEWTGQLRCGRAGAPSGG